nr:alpha/beta hydrolase fold domain-containing protein [Cellulomonas endophytica]
MRRFAHTRVGETVGLTTAALVVLAVVGSLLGPQWDPLPVRDPLEVAAVDTAITGAPVPLPRYEVERRVVEVRLDGTTVEAQITTPVGAGDDLPGVVFVHGAGTGRFAQAFTAQAEALARAGVVTMVPDKRLDTYTLRHRDYPAMAQDYARSVALLREVDAVDPARVGVYAESEGAWIAPVMAAEDPALAFVVLVSAPVVPPREQGAFAADTYLRNTGVPQQVFRAIPRAIGMSLPGGGFEYADFDVTPYQRRTTQPVLVVYGTGDASMPLVQGAQRLLADTALAGNLDVTVRYYAGATHGLRVHGEIAPVFLRDLAGWVVGLPGTAGQAPRIAGDQPVQEYLAAPVPQPRWLRDGTLLLVVVAVGVGLLLLAPLAVGVDRALDPLRRRRDRRAAVRAAGGPGPAGPARGQRAPQRFAPGVRDALVGLAVGTVITVAALVWYLVVVARLALDYDSNAVLVQGGWVLVRAVGVLTVLAGVLLVGRVRAVLRAGERPAAGAVRTTALVVVLAAAAVLLVTLAYWGVFQLGI